MEKISLCQLSFLIDWLKKNEHFDIYDLDFDKPENKGYSKLREMTLKQYKYILYLALNNHYFKVKNILDKFLTHK